LGEPYFRLRGFRRKGRQIDLAQVKSALIVRLDEIGDMVMTSPFLRELRRCLPDAWLTLVVKPGVYNLVERCPHVNEVLTYNWDTHWRLQPLRRHARALQLARERLWQRRFDIAVLPRWDADYYHTTFVAYFSGAAWRVGYSENVTNLKRQMNRGFDCLLTHILRDAARKHELEHDLDVLRFLGGTVQNDQLELWVDEDDRAFAEEVFGGNGVKPDEKVVGLGPSGGTSPLKQWPVNHFIELGRRLLASHHCRLLVLGGRGDAELGQQIEQELGSAVVNVVGKTTLRQMAALLSRCHLYVGNDSGPMHIAAAMGVPVVAMFGSSCHHRFRPWGKQHTVLNLELPCSPCFQPNHPDRCVECIFDQPHCLVDMTVEQVMEAVEKTESVLNVSHATH
jgi:heptosyltransferase-2